MITIAIEHIRICNHGEELAMTVFAGPEPSHAILALYVPIVHEQ